MTDANSDLQTTSEIQGRVISPRTSAWVSANAGSGKTYILTRRVIRLLIHQALIGGGRAAPERIVCITYTKAAAAEMEARLYADLGALSLADDEALKEKILDLGEDDVSAEQLARIRTLFAQALETPGGLKIQTIHSFCERILRRFPIEANLLPGFEVLEHEPEDILEELLTQMMAEAANDREASTAIGRLASDYVLPKTRRSIMSAMVGSLSRLPPDQSPENLIAQLRTQIGLPDGEPADWQSDAMDGVELGFLELMRENAGKFSSELQKRADACDMALQALPSDRIAAFNFLADAWFNNGWKWPKNSFGLKGAEKKLPGITERAHKLMETLFPAADLSMAAPHFHKTANAIRVACELSVKFEQYKNQRSQLDFDDLIRRTVRLLAEVDGVWVRFKLDQGIDHILLDEAQDTAQSQWSVIEHFRSEFMAQEDDNGRERTVFVVGDRKQSIYSFQGADAALFAQKRTEMREAIEGIRPYAEEQLFLSFRSSPAILDVVDKMFEGEAGDGLVDPRDQEPVWHRAKKMDLPGRVEVWPMIEPQEKEKIIAWDLPVDSTNWTSPRRKLADVICEQIADWLSPTGRRRLSTGKPIEPKDILILCRNRSTQFFEIIRALSRNNIPSGGADRIKLNEDVAVRDMLALLRFASNQTDDLSLAEALKSPLWGFDDDDLIALTADRDGRSLWAQLKRYASEKTSLAEKCQSAMEQIKNAEKLGQQSGPFAFFSAHLEEGSPSGWHRFRRRLGSQSDEPLEELLNEALAFEYKNPRSLASFLSHLEQLDSDVKKQPGDAGNVVRVMTVHGAKGLESPIVILADANDKLLSSRDNTLSFELEGAGDLKIPKPASEDQRLTPIIEAVKDANTRRTEEFRRNLYVAATRAEEELYFCGVGKSKTKTDPEDLHDRACVKDIADRPWLGLAVEGIRRLDGVEEIPAPWGSDAPILRYSTGAAAPSADVQLPDAVHPQALPAWLTTPVTSEAGQVIQFPSETAEGDDAAPGIAYAPHGDRTHRDVARRRGTLIHALLQVLPSIEADRRREVGGIFLASRASELDPDIAAEWLDEVMAILDHPHIADVFGEGSQAEVAVHGTVGEKLYSGQIDRLVVTADTIRFIEYKTHRPPPAGIDDVSADILGQVRVYAQLLMAAYPGRRVEAAILWTHVPDVMEVPSELLNPA